jgi:L-alanine-DL-glutamate epimerase-like enolase superfamily enzyme
LEPFQSEAFFAGIDAVSWSRSFAESPLTPIDVVSGDGVTGHGIVFTYTAAALHATAELIRNFEPLLKGEAAAPSEIEHKLARRFRLLGTQGPVGMALAGIDMALWDALARSHNTSLVRLLGGEEPLRAYGAVGYDGVSGSARVAEDWARRGFTGIKAKIGYSERMWRSWSITTKPHPRGSYTAPAQAGRRRTDLGGGAYAGERLSRSRMGCPRGRRAYPVR